MTAANAYPDDIEALKPCCSSAMLALGISRT
ncbi:hypothetical protein BTQ_2481 [Burkholderia thailandensis 2002721723]|nr:hypothetical protein BTQ_2481 [Burkholderia thailandensis 2002721723]